MNLVNGYQNINPMKHLLLTLTMLIGIQPLWSRADERPNVVVFLVDDMGLMDTSVPFLADEHGKPATHPLNKYYQTPNMEALAKQGIRFETFYAKSVCSPSRVSLMTGQSSARHGTTTWINPTKRNKGPGDWNWKGLDGRSVTLPRLLQGSGYRTIHIDKAHMGPVRSEGADPVKLGFDVNVAGSAIGRPKSYSGQSSYGKGDLRQPPHLEAYHGTDTHLSDALTIEACKAVDAAVAQGRPFYLNMWHYAVHSPYQPDPRFIGKYDDALGQNMPAFASLIEGMDKSLGDLLAHLNKIDQAENTLIFFLGDNGSAAPVTGDKHGIISSAPLRGKKGSHYEGGMRVPFIAAWAKVNLDHPLQRQFPVAQNAITTTAFATIEDLMPTVLALTGTDAPEAHVMDGINILPALAKADTPTGRHHFLMHFPHRHCSSNFTAYREEEWKITRHYDSGTLELFDLTSDPTESSDLSRTRPERLRAMQAAMQKRLDDAEALYMEK